MRLALSLIAIGAVLMLEPRMIYLDGVKSTPMRYERTDWRHLTPSQAMLIGAPRTVTVWP